MKFKARISVFGGRNIDKQTFKDTVELGRLMAKENWLVFCGGGPGVMEAISKGVKEEGGICVGILQGQNPAEGNPYVQIPIATGMGIGRNVILAYNCDVAVAVSGRYGTLSEIAYALQLEKPVIGYKTWELLEIEISESPSDVITKVKEKLYSCP